MNAFDALYVSPETAATYIQNAMTVAMSGYSMAGYPKAVPKALCARRAAGQSLAFHLVTGANVPWLDDVFAQHEMISRRTPMCADKRLAKQINTQSVGYVEQQMNKMQKLLRQNAFGTIDVAVIEALAITKDGIIPTTSMGFNSMLMDAAQSIIIEVNTGQPDFLATLHDFYCPAPPPHTQPIPLTSVAQRIGTHYIPVDMRKVVAIVSTNLSEEKPDAPVVVSQQMQNAATVLMGFLHQEYGPSLPPVQLGFGGMADAIANAFSQSNFEPLSFYCGGVGKPVIDLLREQKAACISTGGIVLTAQVKKTLETIENLSQKLILRNGNLTNAPEIIERLGLLTLNTGIEVDIYGNVNASHIYGSRVINGIGGGAGFSQGAGLSVVVIPATSKGGNVSSIVPMVPHTDIGEHDVDVLITEYGVADLRGLDDKERAQCIIEHCAAPSFRSGLKTYLQQASAQVGGHHPVLLTQAFAWHQRLQAHGTMMEDWE